MPRPRLYDYAAIAAYAKHHTHRETRARFGCTTLTVQRAIREQLELVAGGTSRQARHAEARAQEQAERERQAAVEKLKRQAVAVEDGGDRGGDPPRH
jgi:hypothetical protein